MRAKLLVLEDDEDTLNALVRIFRQTFVVFPAPNLRVAQRHLEENPDIHFCFCDGVMPIAAGMEPDVEASLAFVKKIRIEHVHLIVIVCSAFKNPEFEKAGAHYVISKPSTESVVTRVLEIAIRHSPRPVSFVTPV